MLSISNFWSLNSGQNPMGFFNLKRLDYTFRLNLFKEPIEPGLICKFASLTNVNLQIVAAQALQSIELSKNL